MITDTIRPSAGYCEQEAQMLARYKSWIDPDLHDEFDNQIETILFMAQVHKKIQEPHFYLLNTERLNSLRQPPEEPVCLYACILL